ncbi:hypothetical protein WG66_016509 [Moniliophthora roreri]|nr:hypothetical protein WG66_016509 [Moniliophthora roreri]
MLTSLATQASVLRPEATEGCIWPDHFRGLFEGCHGT